MPGLRSWDNTTRLEQEADKQSLYFSARQEPYNIPWVAKWIKYAGRESFNCQKKLSDSPELKAAVSREQALVVYHQIRTEEMKFNLRIPEAMTKIIITYYTQPAIYPTPRWIKYRPPTAGHTSYELSWKIHDKESYKDLNHASNVGRVWLIMRRKPRLHPWHC